MRGTLILLALSVGLAAGCERVSNSRFNPLNWFERSSGADILLEERAAPVETRPLMDQVVTLEAVPRPGGAILRATGVATRQGYFGGALVPVRGAGAGLLAYEFRVEPPFAATRVSTPQSREVTVAVFLTDRQLAGIREIRVSGARNARAVRR